MRIVPTVLSAALLLASNFAVAGAREDLAVFTKGLKGLDGQFSQQVFDVRGKQKEASSGRVAVSAPRLFRWEYTKPYAQLVVADGKTVWVVDPDLNQATRRPQGPEEANSPLAILLEPARLERDFAVKDGGSRDGVAWLEVAPRSTDASFKTARLGFAGSKLARLEYVDALGQRTVIAFSGWKRNPAFAKGTFAYAPGKGVDVIGN
ncbi:outer membrane lipoprotein chaperone LolA [Thermomonas sp.]|jgi:outer membrane lipoprotein carrier protein|uniref:outer membrane lipoprotein chaperone LolA n=1 Tax=Thermomonas sp. TaxID=1971895 RepID=UPI0025798255|nr:outer membrane lipoprotein chaperone LolA [Thermomonas sp.]